jgi:MFS family permease
MAAFSSSIYILILSRAIQGIGVAMFVIAFGIIRDRFPREKISIGQGVISSMFASGAVIGLLIGGIVINNYGWHATFLSTIPIAIALFIVVWRFHKETRQEHNPQQYHRIEQHQQQKPQKATESQSPSLSTPGVDNFSASRGIDIKGALALAAFITSFLIALTLVETGSGNSGMEEVVLFLIIGTTTLAFFIFIERNSKTPLVDFKLITNKTILPSNLIIMVVGFSMFLVFQTIPVLVGNPPPLGFGGNAEAAGYVQLPFAIVLLIFGPTSGYIVSKLGSIRPIILGTVITAIAFFALLIFHQSAVAVAVNLAVLSTGLSLTNVGAMNITILSTPPQFIGMSLGMNNLLRIIGSSVGPALAGVFMQMFQQNIQIAGKPAAFPSMQAYSIIFLTAGMLAIASICLAIYLRHHLQNSSIPNIA